MFYSPQLNSAVQNFSVYDGDIGSNSMLTFDLINNTAEVFAVMSSPDQLSSLLVTEPLDYETLPYHLLTLVVRDRGTPGQSSMATLEIFITDVADTLPIFNVSSYSEAIPEDTAMGTTLTQFHASTSDSPMLSGVKYSIAETRARALFAVGETSGQLRVVSTLDYETDTLHRFTVRAVSSANGLLQSEIPVMLSVLNVNEHAPLFSRSVYEVSVGEDVPVDTQVITVSAQDGDGGTLGMLSYRVGMDTDEDARVLFSIDATAGVIRTHAELHGPLTHTLTVEARDGGEMPMTSRATVVISVVTSGIGAALRPVFTSVQYSAEVSEAVSPPHEVITVGANGSNVTYYILSGNVCNVFSIGSDDGCIRIPEVMLDRERQATYELVIVARSAGGGESSATVLVSVTDSNDHAPEFELSEYRVFISESAEAGAVLLNISAVDNDVGANSTLSYSISESVESLFNIEESSGRLSLRGELDYEQFPTNLSFTVTCSDAGTPPLNSSAQVIVYILDANDNAPQFDPTPSGTVPIWENQPAFTPVTQISASDADSALNGLVRYSLLGDVWTLAALGVDPITGLLFTKLSLDREGIEHYNVTVLARDGGVSLLSSELALTVVVLDEVDDPPLFLQGEYRALITTNLSANATILTVAATTRDNVSSSVIHYSLSGERSALFSVEETTGRVMAAGSLDPEANRGTYELQITATHQTFSTTASVVITVRPKDDVPRLHPLTVYLNVYPSLVTLITDIGSVRVEEPNPALSYRYSLQYSDPVLQKLFRIEPTSGAISVFNNITSGSYQLNVSVTTPTSEGCGLVTVHMCLVTNATLEEAVVVTFTGTSEAQFLDTQLDALADFITDISASTTQNQVEIFGLQMTSLQEVEVLEVSLAVRSSWPDQYIPANMLRDLLYRHLSDIPSPLRAPLAPALATSSTSCDEDTCPNLQQCRPLLQLHGSAPPSSSLHSLNSSSGRLLYHSHLFSQTHHCLCPPGYSRDDLCTSELNECEPNPCRLGSECTDLIGDYQCSCPEGTTDKNCSTVCLRETCAMCDSAQCRYGGTCQTRLSGCSNCPWSSQDYSGPRCELTSLHFDPGAYVALPTLSSTAGVAISLSFATISPSGVLLYNGQHNSRTDFITVELVIGQIKVGVSFGGMATILLTNSEQRLNDGAWHHVEVLIRNRVSKIEPLFKYLQKF